VEQEELVTLSGTRDDSRFENEITFELGSAFHAVHMSCLRPVHPGMALDEIELT
jgi:hypothetical protein